MFPLNLLLQAAMIAPIFLPREKHMNSPNMPTLDAQTDARLRAFMEGLKELTQHYEIHAFTGFFAATHLGAGPLAISVVRAGCSHCLALALASGLNTMPDAGKEDLAIAIDIVKSDYAQIALLRHEKEPDPVQDLSNLPDISKMN